MVILARLLPPIVAGAILLHAIMISLLAGPVRTLALICTGLCFAAALVIRRATLRAHATVAVGCGAVVASGQARPHDTIYIFGAFAFAFAAIWCLRSARTSLGKKQQTSGFDWRAPATTLVAGALLTALLGTQLPRAGRAVEQRIARRWASRAGDTHGINSSIEINAFMDLLQNDDIVMRVDGEPVEYLRGQAYDHYNAWHQWTTSLKDQVHPIEEAAAPFERGTTRLVLVRGAAGRGREARWFLPDDACEVGTPSKIVTVDPDRVVHPEPWWTAESIWFRTRDCRTHLPAAGEPRDWHTEILPKLAKQLLPIAQEWTKGMTTDREKLGAIQRHLASFEYTLKYDGDPRVDPVVYFLTVRRSGHCGLFASAMALLGRALGIPTRMVAGYRGSEVNSIDGHGVVRERNAHAWVEAYVDGSWRTWDPTPLTEGAPPKSSFIKELGETISFGTDRALIALGRLELLDIAAALVVVVVVLFALRALLQRLARRARRKKQDLGAPLPCLEELTSALAKKGWEREPSEPLERFARRLAKTKEPWAREVEKALLAYANLRYGSVGKEDAIVREVEAAARLTSS